MNPEEINIVIEEACGFYVHHEGAIAYISRDPKPNWDHRVYQSCPMPDYCNDLNAMAEAEKTLSGHKGDPNSQKAEYYEHLVFICGTRTDPPDVYEWDLLTATAAQRAEAFLKTIGKWRESVDAKIESINRAVSEKAEDMG